MSNASGELTDGFHPLRLVKRGFRLFALGDIHQNSSQPDRTIIRAVTYSTLGCNPPHLAVPSIDTAFNFETAALRGVFKRVFDYLPVFVNDVREKLARAPR